MKDIIFNKCFPDYNKSIILSGNWTNYKKRFVFLSFFQPIYLLGIDETDTLETYKTQIKRYNLHDHDTTEISRFGAKKFVVDEININAFELVINKLKYSKWWNIHGFFLIKYTDTFNSCKFYSYWLTKIWEFDVSNAVFLCQNSFFEICLFTFNPYSAKAPKFWQNIESVRQKNGHLLTIFSNCHLTKGMFNSCFFIGFFIPTSLN